jgi:hypothetical protein
MIIVIKIYRDYRKSFNFEFNLRIFLSYFLNIGFFYCAGSVLSLHIRLSFIGDDKKSLQATDYDLVYVERWSVNYFIKENIQAAVC